MYGLITYLAGPGKREEHVNPRVVAASSSLVFRAGGEGGVLSRNEVQALADVIDEARVIFGTEVTRMDKRQYRAAIERGEDHQSAVLTATHAENVWHCSLAVQPEELEALAVDHLDDATWSAIAHDFMTGMGFTAPGVAPAEWVAVHHGKSVNGNDHIHIAASRARQDGSVVALWSPHPEHGRPEGDKARAQRICREIAAERGLRVVGDPSKGDPSTPALSPGQEASAERAGLAEAPQDELRRRVGIAATASESEAEFVRMVRTGGILINPFWSKGRVTGYSVGFPANRFADRYGRPIMHGAYRKLGPQFTLPRLRERWIDSDGARADAVAAWHTAAADMPPTSSTVGRKQAAAYTEHAAATERDRRSRRRDYSDRLAAVIVPIAQRAATEAEFVRALRANPDIAIRPRYARGSLDVVGYVAALRPPKGERPVWCGASYIPGANLTDLRKSWPNGPEARADAATAWATRRQTTTTPYRPGQVKSAAADSARWYQMLTSLPQQNSAGWARAAGDTADVCAAAALRMSGHQQRALINLSDALRASSSVRRRPRRPASSPATAACRVAATMIAATREDTTLLWLSVMAQIVAAAGAVGDCRSARAETHWAVKVSVAISDVRAQFPEKLPIENVPAAPPTRTAHAWRGSRPEYLRSATSAPKPRLDRGM
ncbi:MAG: relaxase [Gordonia amarae]